MSTLNRQTLAREIHTDLAGRGQPSIPAIYKCVGALGRIMRRRAQTLEILNLIHRSGKKRKKKTKTA